MIGLINPDLVTLRPIALIFASDRFFSEALRLVLHKPPFVVQDSHTSFNPNRLTPLIHMMQTLISPI